MIDHDIRKKLDIYANRLTISNNKNYRTQIRTELMDFVEKIEDNGSKRVEYMVYVFNKSSK